jgi:hypothetical protein
MKIYMPKQQQHLKADHLSSGRGLPDQKHSQDVKGGNRIPAQDVRHQKAQSLFRLTRKIPHVQQDQDT